MYNEAVHSIVQPFQQMCSAIKGTGRKMDSSIKIGMKWLCSVLDQLYEKLKLRVDKDVEEMRRQEQIEKEERRERVRKQREERWEALSVITNFPSSGYPLASQSQRSLSPILG